jgi:hypothetical protein
MYIRKRLRVFLESLAEKGQDWGTPERLLAEARAGLQLIDQEGMAWFPFELVPDCHWQSGETVSREILCWWIILTSYLEDPEPTPLIQDYLDLLDAPSLEYLGLFLLKIFVVHEARGARAEDARAYASANAFKRGNSLPVRSDSSGSSQSVDPELDQKISPMWAERPGKGAAGVARGAKGILALAGRTPEAMLVASVTAYFRENPPNWSQQIALLKVLGTSGTRSAVQFLVSKASHSPSQVVEEAAGQMIYRVAERKGLTLEELTDQSVPTAGLDEWGVLHLDYGPRQFQAILQESLQLQLIDATGKAVKSLPKPNKTDDPAKVVEAKQTLAESRKGVQQIRTNWKHRLYEFMCIQKSWAIGDWQTYLLANPVLGRMFQKLVWMNDEGSLFRPSASGTLVDAANNGIEIKQGRVRLAHASLVNGELAGAWLQHGRDHAVDWVFPQMERFTPPSWLIGSQDMLEINDLAGSAMDALSFYGTLKRLGYARTGFSEGQHFSSMTKIYSTLKIMVEIEFTGAYVPTHGGWAALKSLHFNKLPGSERVPLRDVPPVLLAESYFHYQTVAKKGSGYDPDWKVKMR